MDLAIVVLNYRTPKLAIGCLRSLAEDPDALRDARVIIADNASEDGSADAINAAIHQHGWGRWADLLPLDRNGGYAAGNNAAIRLALGSPAPPRFLMILNPDTIVRPGTIPSLLQFMSAHPDIGIVGCQIEDAHGQPECSAHRLPRPLSELDGSARLGFLSRILQKYVVSPPIVDEPHLCEWVSGSAMVVRREVFEKIGLMDEGYFLYFDEVDFCARAGRAGWPVWYLPSARIVHLEGSSTGISRGRKRRAPYWYNSRRRFFVKNYGVIGLFFADLLWAAGRLAFNLRKILAVKSDSDPSCFAWDLLWGDFRATLSGAVFRIRRERNPL